LAILFFSEQVVFNFPRKRIVKEWIKESTLAEGRKVGDVNVIFSTDEYILEINKKFLNHDYFTDIITFNYNHDLIIGGDIYISIDTVKKNAEQYSVDFIVELHRVIIHGFLHLIGFDDKTDESQVVMRTKEDYYLNTLSAKLKLLSK
jgi:probable rRNA maturation factor